MKKITKDELDVFLRKHKLWIEGEVGGERADLRGANLRGADLYGANLRGADLRGADLYGANLRGADLYGANLRGADLRGADLYGANLRGADLYGANLRGANLRGADLREAKNVSLPIACPEKGEFIAFKRAGGYIVELKVTEDAKRCSATSRKCRCSKAIVLSITTLAGENDGTTAVRSNYDKTFVYRIGETVEVSNFCDDRWRECSAGIHFFITRQEAVEYR